MSTAAPTHPDPAAPMAPTRPGPSSGGEVAPGPTRRPLRLLDVTSFYSDTVSGGVKTYLHAKAARLAAHGVEHLLAVPGEAGEESRVHDTGVVHIPGVVIPVSRSYRAMASVRTLSRVIRRFRPDVIEVGSPFIVPLLLRRALAGLPVPTVGFYHADIVRTFAEPYVPARAAAPIRVVARMAARRLVRRVYGRFDATVAASATVVEELRQLGVSRVRAVGLGVDLETFRPLPPDRQVDWRRHGIPRGRPVGIFAGRFCAEKRLDVVLDAHARLPEAGRPHLVLVGGGPHRARLERRSREQAGLTLLPYVRDRPELARLYASADFYLATGPGETFGLSIAEALACGLPLLVVDRAAAPDRIRGSRAGERYAHGDAESARAALGRLLPRLGPALALEARAHAEATLDWDRTVAKLVELYRELAGRGRAGGVGARRHLTRG